MIKILCLVFSFYVSTLQYHGTLIGFHNLYIIDSSTNTHCISFLRYARDILGVNVLFSDANLNQLESIMTDIGAKISGSSDFILKVDIDEFLTVYMKMKLRPIAHHLMQY